MLKCDKNATGPEQQFHMSRLSASHQMSTTKYNHGQEAAYVIAALPTAPLHSFPSGFPPNLLRMTLTEQLALLHVIRFPHCPLVEAMTSIPESGMTDQDHGKPGERVRAGTSQRRKQRDVERPSRAHEVLGLGELAHGCRPRTGDRTVPSCAS